MGFDQLIDIPTRTTQESATIIDIILVNRPRNISRHGVIPLSMSDHDCIGCVRKLNHERFSPRNISCRNYNRYDSKALNKDLAACDWNAVYTSNCPNESWAIMKCFLEECFNKNAPWISKRVKGRYCPWLSEDVKRHMNERDQLLRKARKSNKTSDWKTYKQKKNACTKFIRKARNTYQRDMLEQNRGDAGKFWDIIKRVFPCKPLKSGGNKAPFIDDSDDTAKSKANAFCNFFTNVANRLKCSAYPLLDFVWKRNNSFPLRTKELFRFQYVSKVFVEHQLRKLKTKKSAGHDELPPKLLKDSASTIAGPLSHIINISLKSGIVPSEWKFAKIIPLHKSGSKTTANNYRPISILSVASKIMERAVHIQLIEYLESNCLLSKNQFGFRKGRSTELATTLLTDNIRKDADKGKLVGALFIDLSKAFDTLGHAVLLSKLQAYGIMDSELNWFTSYLFDRKQVCYYDGEQSDIQSVRCGVPQGSILGPLLFLLHFNDLEEVLSHSRLIQFADDTVIYVSDKCFHTIENKLNDDIKAIRNYFLLNELIINLNKGKTECILFGTAKRLAMYPNDLNLYYGDTKIVNSIRYKYLGTKVKNTLNMDENFSSVYKQASSKLKMLSAISDGLSKNCLDKIYRTMVLPAFMYNCLTLLKFNEGQMRKLDSIKSRAEKITSFPQKDIYRLIEKKSVLVVKKSLAGMLCDNFTGYFQYNISNKPTRSKNWLLKIPKVKLEFAKVGFFSMGVKNFNALPIEIRQTPSFLKFKEKCNEFFEV